MSTSFSAFLFAGISLQEFFKKVGTKIETYDEYNQRGIKTGRQITEKKLIATLPDGNEVIIGEYYTRFHHEEIEYDFYSSLSFDGGESQQTDLELYELCATENLSEMILGYPIKGTVNSNGWSDGSYIAQIDTNLINEKLVAAQKELKKKFGFDGEAKLYLVKSVY